MAPTTSSRNPPLPNSTHSEEGESETENDKNNPQLDPERVKALNKALDGQGKTKQSAQNWYEVLDRGIAYYMDMYEGTDMKTFENQYQKELDVFSDMITHIKCFESDLSYFVSPRNVERKDDLAKAMIAASGAARSEDISTLQSAIITYINECSPTNKVEISATATKSESRGFKNKVLARLLCPMKYLEDFDANPDEFMRKLDEDVVHVLAKDLPTFLWEPGKFDPEDWDSDMFRTRLLVMVWKHIFTSPSSALKDKPGQTKTRSSQAKLHHMKTVTPASIAYACLLIRYSISGIEDWRIEDNVFDRQGFYNYIISLFEPDKEDDGDSDWSTDTIEWWNAKVLNKDPRSAKSEENLDGPSTYDTIAEQRRARKARKSMTMAATAAVGGKEKGGSSQGKGGAPITESGRVGGPHLAEGLTLVNPARIITRLTLPTIVIHLPCMKQLACINNRVLVAGLTRIVQLANWMTMGILLKGMYRTCLLKPFARPVRSLQVHQPSSTIQALARQPKCLESDHNLLYRITSQKIVDGQPKKRDPRPLYPGYVYSVTVKFRSNVFACLR
ncbi:hypothetical protein JR316_0001493 [Psilocybe cubensis]|uniref:Uncharacterized protein n=2 Tax=Psilocybe cubensis TaxID=181762 RepID=A0ACB8HHM3_PSICU|nr:hypothetical protein JR316_0001493 [Psilocybe cubensis]KAH9487418.1 hypothetical protein JR316_0001493 [Psilocybe cubensis]